MSAENDKLLIDALGNEALDPLSLRAMFLMLTRAHYSSADNYGKYSKRMEKYVWSQSPKPALFIDYDYNYDPKNKDRIPGIFVGTDDFAHIKKVNANTENMSADRAAETLVKVTNTNVIIRHLGGSATDSLTLGTISEQFFCSLHKLMQEKVKLYSYEVVQLKTSRPFEFAAQQADQQYMVDLIINVQYLNAWQIVRESHRIKTIGIKQALDSLSWNDKTTQV